MPPPGCIALAYLAAALAVPAALDLLYREVDPEIWAPLLIVGAGIGFYYATSTGMPLVLYYGASLALALVAGLLYLAGLLGGADALAMTLIALTLPVPPRPGLPPVVVVTFYATLLSLVHRTIIMVRVGGPRAALRSALEVRAEELLSDPRYRWWIPRGVHVEEDMLQHIAANLGGKLRAGPGTPLVFHMLLGLLAYTVLGDPAWRLLPG